MSTYWVLRVGSDCMAIPKLELDLFELQNVQLHKLVVWDFCILQLIFKFSSFIVWSNLRVLKENEFYLFIYSLKFKVQFAKSIHVTFKMEK